MSKAELIKSIYMLMRRKDVEEIYISKDFKSRWDLNVTTKEDY